MSEQLEDIDQQIADDPIPDDGGKKKKNGSGQADAFLKKIGKTTTVKSQQQPSEGMAAQFLQTVKKKNLLAKIYQLVFPLHNLH